MKKLTLIIISIGILISCVGRTTQIGTEQKGSEKTLYISKVLGQGNKSKDGLITLQYESNGGLLNNDYVYITNTINGETTYQIISKTQNKILKEKKSNDSAILKMISDFESYVPESINEKPKLSDIGVDGPEVSFTLINKDHSIRYENYDNTENQFVKLNELSNRFKNYVALTLFEPKYLDDTLSIKTEIGSKIEVLITNKNWTVVRKFDVESMSEETRIGIGSIEENQEFMIVVDKIPIYVMK